MTHEQELRRWREAPAERPTGRDDASPSGIREQETPWRWRTLVENLAPMSHAVLDLSTEGGRDLAALPSADGAFDLVLSRHPSYDARALAHLLAPGGAFLTQQVGGDDLREIIDHLGIDPHFPDVTLTAFEHALTRAGLTIERSAPDRHLEPLPDPRPRSRRTGRGPHRLRRTCAGRPRGPAGLTASP